MVLGLDKHFEGVLGKFLMVFGDFLMGSNVLVVVAVGHNV